MKVTLSLACIGAASAFAPVSRPASGTALSETKADLEALAKEINPALPFWDPMGLADKSFWGESNEATIGWLRQSEIKHGRVAMAAFVGYVVQSNVHFPWKMST